MTVQHSRLVFEALQKLVRMRHSGCEEFGGTGCEVAMSKFRDWMPKERHDGCMATTDPAIKLFGKTIGVISSHTDAGADAGVLSVMNACPWDIAPSCSQEGKDGVVLQAEEEGVYEERKSSASSTRRVRAFYPSKSSGEDTEFGAADMGVLSEDSEAAQPEVLKEDDEEGHNHGSDEKGLCKPDKLVACPRCDSLDTKFCYYNNYNVNQPRHFCKNCQRYWTAGGTLRNVPVGAGRRKNKHGGLQRDGPEGAIVTAGRSDRPDSAQQLLTCSLENVTPLKIPQPTRLLLPGQSSPLRSPGSTSSFGQESGLSMSSPYSVLRNGTMHSQSFSGGNGFFSSGADMIMMGSSDSQRLMQCPMMTNSTNSGENWEDGEPALRRFKKEIGNSTPVQSSSFNTQTESDTFGTLRTKPLKDAGNWTRNEAPSSSFNGAWPYGHHVEWKGTPPIPIPRGAAFYTSASADMDAGPKIPYGSSWSPAHWNSVGWVPPTGTSSGWMERWTGPYGVAATVHSSLATPSTYGKRAAPESRGVDSAPWAPKSVRVEDPKETSKCVWRMLGKDPPEVIECGGTFRFSHRR